MIAALVLMLAVPTQTPPARWECAAAAYSDGAVCDCGCDAPDPDCTDGEFINCDTSSCSAGQVPWEHSSSACMGSTCGDGWKDDGEACDELRASGTDGCSADCSSVNEGFTCGERATGCEAVAEGEGEGEGTEGEGEGTEGEGEAAAEGEGEGEAAEGEGEGGEDDGGCAGTPAGLAVALLALIGRRRVRAA